MEKEKTALGDAAKSKLQHRLSNMRAKFESYQRESKKKLDDPTAPYN